MHHTCSLMANFTVGGPKMKKKLTKNIKKHGIRHRTVNTKGKIA